MYYCLHCEEVILLSKACLKLLAAYAKSDARLDYVASQTQDHFFEHSVVPRDDRGISTDAEKCFNIKVQTPQQQYILYATDTAHACAQPFS